VFVPLAQDATLAALREVLAAIHAGAATDEERAELYTALLVMAAIDPWGHNLRKELTMMVEDKEEGLLRRTPIIGEMILEAELRGQLKGEEIGQLKGEEIGQLKAIAELLGRLFARRVGRRPTTEEERSIVERARALGPGEVEDALLDLERYALVRWLAEPVRRS
jgi:predicted transposase YdaD